MFRSFFHAAIAFFIFAAPTSAYAAGDVIINKPVWTSLSQSAQTSIVIGALSGYEAGFQGGGIAASGERKKHETSSVQPVQFSKTYGFYRTAITDFYVGHAGSEAVPVGAIVGCLADGVQPSFCASLLQKFPQ